MIHTLADARTFCAPFIGEGVAPSDSKVLSTLNEAIELLMVEADWRTLVQKIRVKTYNNCLVLPANVETVLKVGFDSKPANVWSQYYEFMDAGPGILYNGNNTWTNDLVDEGDGFPIFFPIGASPKHLLALSTESGDVDKEIRVRGIDDLSMEINPTTPGEMLKIFRWKDGEEGTIDRASISAYTSTNEFQDINSIVKPQTSGYVTLFAYDPDTDGMWLLAKYGPYETQPGYRRYRITNSTTSNQECITALVKLRYTPLVHETDVLAIQSLPALKQMCKALHQFDYGDAGTAAMYQQTAIRILNKKHESAYPASNEIDFQCTEGIGDYEDWL